MLCAVEGVVMRIVGKRDVEKYMVRHANAVTPLKCWVQKAESSDWKTLVAIKADFASASFLAGNRVVFSNSADFLIGNPEPA